MKRPVTITVAAILVLLMVLVAAIWPLVGGDQMIGVESFNRSRGGMPGNFSGTPQAQMQGTPMPDQNGQNPGGQPPAQDNQIQSTPMAGQNGQGQPGQGRFGNGPRQNGMFGGLRIFEYVLYAAIIVLGLISFGGLWNWKKWGTLLAIITSAVVVAGTVPSFIRVFSPLLLVEAILKIALAIAVIVLVLLPKSKIMETNVA